MLMSTQRRQRSTRQAIGGGMIVPAMIGVLVVGIITNTFLLMAGVAEREVSAAEIRRQLAHEAPSEFRQWVTTNMQSITQEQIEFLRTQGELARYQNAQGSEIVVTSGTAEYYSWRNRSATVIDGDAIYSLDARITVTATRAGQTVSVSANVGVPSLAEWGIIKKDGDWDPQPGYHSSGPLWVRGDFRHNGSTDDDNKAVIYGSVHADGIAEFGDGVDVPVFGGQYVDGDPGYKPGGDYTPGDASNGEDGDDAYFQAKADRATLVIGGGNKEIYLGRDGYIYMRDYMSSDDYTRVQKDGVDLRQADVRSLYFEDTVFVKGTIEGRFTLFSGRDVVVFGRIYNNEPDQHVLGIASKDDTFLDFRPLTETYTYTSEDGSSETRFGWDPWWGVNERWRQITDTSGESAPVGSAHHTTGILDTNARRQPLPYDFNLVDTQSADADHMSHPMDWAPFITPQASTLAGTDPAPIEPTVGDATAHYEFNNQIAAVIYSADDFEFLTHTDYSYGRDSQFGHALYREDLGDRYAGIYGFNAYDYYRSQLDAIYPGYTWSDGFHLFGGVTAEGTFTGDWRWRDWFPQRHFGFNPAQRRNPPPEFPSGFRGPAGIRNGSWKVDFE